MNFLITFVNTFLVDYFFIFIINLLPIKNKLKWQIGVISLTNLPSMGYDLYTIISSIPYMGVEILIYVGVLFSKILAYVAIMVWLLQGRKVFKTRRQREFLRDYKGTNKNSMIASIIIFVLSALTLGFIIYVIINYNKELLLTLIGAIIGFLVLTGFALYLLPLNKCKNIVTKTKKPTNLLFILKIKDSKVVFESPYKEDLNYYLGTLADDFVLSNHGMIEQGKTIYLVKGISVDYIDKCIVKDIKMNILKNDKLIEICNLFNQYQQKYIKVDSNFNITSEKTE